MRMSQQLVVAVSTTWLALAPLGCERSPQDLPVTVSADGAARGLEWRDAHGVLDGEVPWVVRSDLRGPDTALVVTTPDGDACARSVSFRVLAAGTTEYRVSLDSDLRGAVSWRVGYGEGGHMKLFGCDPRPAAEPRRGCLHGGIPKPLMGELVGDVSAELADGTRLDGLRTFRFERGVECAGGGGSGTGPATGTSPTDTETDAGATGPS